MLCWTHSIAPKSCVLHPAYRRHWYRDWLSIIHLCSTCQRALSRDLFVSLSHLATFARLFAYEITRIFAMALVLDMVLKSTHPILIIRIQFFVFVFTDSLLSTFFYVPFYDQLGHLVWMESFNSERKKNLRMLYLSCNSCGQLFLVFPVVVDNQSEQ